ncbi:MAG TPA: type II toxin-antitoxin system RelE/ParE family toxin, partial [Geobacteraceae bacterium]|nr:type II toxin-antitoxin system RelE/ParE family toxin [Geobacteraceae bacterium]
MAAVIWTEKSLADLEGIYDYIAVYSPFSARHQVEKIVASVERLQEFPGSGRPSCGTDESLYCRDELLRLLHCFGGIVAGQFNHFFVVGLLTHVEKIVQHFGVTRFNSAGKEE